MINNEQNIPFEVKIVHGSEVPKTYSRLCEKEDITPIILGGKDNVETLFDLEFEETPEEIIEKSKHFDIKEFIKNREEEFEYYPMEELLGEWTGCTDKQREEPIAHLDILSGKPLEEVYIGVLPTKKSFETPAYVSFGNWNKCPSPEDHVGIMRYWNEKYGAEVVSMTSDIIECTIKNPPSTKEEALELAKEQFFYCPDIVVQGTQTIFELAEALLNSKYWFFWWD
jgi:hypothetical protein